MYEGRQMVRRAIWEDERGMWWRKGVGMRSYFRFDISSQVFGGRNTSGYVMVNPYVAWSH